MPVLYRKYRPQTFDAVVGQEHITRTLGAAIAAGRVAHAYLFSGPRGVGKTTTARLIAKAVCCESVGRETLDAERNTNARQASSGKRQAIPCNACIRCEEITAGRCVDVVEIDAATYTKVEETRSEIIEKVRIAPAVAARKVYIIDEVHMLSTASFNALLKTLEEPPAHALFILATTELHKVPETIRSRCQHFTFRRVSDAVLTERLGALAHDEGVTVEDDVIAQVVRAADGSVRDGESLLGQILALGGKQVSAADAALVLPRSNHIRVRELFAAVGAGSAAGILAAIGAAEEEGCDAEAFLRDAVSDLRTAIHTSAARGTVAPAPIAMLRACTELLDRVGRSDRPFFLIEVAMLTLIQGTQGASRVTTEEKGQHGNSLISRHTSAVPAIGNRKSEIGNSAEDVGRDRDDVPPAPPSVSAPSDPPVKQKIKDERTPVVRIKASGGSENHESATAALSTVQAAWQSIVVALADQNRAIPYLLEGGRPQRVVGNVLTIGFRYRLHAEKVRAPAIQDVLAAAVSARVGRSLRIETTVVSIEEFSALEATCRPITGDATADAALEVFGGKVIG